MTKQQCLEENLFLDDFFEIDDSGNVIDRETGHVVAWTSGPADNPPWGEDNPPPWLS